MDISGFKSAVVQELQTALRNVPVYRGRPSIGSDAYVLVGRLEDGTWDKEALGGLGSAYRGTLRLPVSVMSASGFSSPAQAETQTYKLADQVITALYGLDFAGLSSLHPVGFSELVAWDESPDQTFALLIVFEALFYGPPLLGGNRLTAQP